jgi:hypothetical protein
VRGREIKDPQIPNEAEKIEFCGTAKIEDVQSFVQAVEGVFRVSSAARILSECSSQAALPMFPNPDEE